MRQIRWFHQQLHTAWHRLWQREDGANLVFVALAMSVLLGFAGLAIDGSNVYYQNQRMQIAADAAALGGARLLALDHSTADARKEAQALGAANGADPIPDDAITFPNGNTEIQVTASRTFTTFFASVVGYDTMTVSASASAKFVKVVRQSADNLLPVIVPCDEVATYTIGSTYTLKEGKTGPGNFGWIRWKGDNPSAETLEENIANLSKSKEWDINDWVKGSTGQMNSGPVRTALQALIDTKKVVTIPLYGPEANHPYAETRGSGSNFEYHICGFAEFVLVGYGDKTLTGKFVRTVARGEIVTDSTPNFGAYDVRITQ